MAVSRRRKLLVISYRFPPETYPLAIRVAYMLNHLKEEWDIHAVTGAKNPAAPPGGHGALGRIG